MELSVMERETQQGPLDPRPLSTIKDGPANTCLQTSAFHLHVNYLPPVWSCKPPSPPLPLMCTYVMNTVVFPCNLPHVSLIRTSKKSRKNYSPPLPTAAFS